MGMLIGLITQVYCQTDEYTIIKIINKLKEQGKEGSHIGFMAAELVDQIEMVVLKGQFLIWQYVLDFEMNLAGAPTETKRLLRALKILGGISVPEDEKTEPGIKIIDDIINPKVN